MRVSRQIGAFKRDRNLAVLQEALAQGEHLRLSRAFLGVLLKAIHQESINHQIKMLYQEAPPSRAAP